MRWLTMISALILLNGCGAMTDYSPETGSRSSYLGNQGGAGVQAPIWSDDPGKKTIINQSPTP